MIGLFKRRKERKSGPAKPLQAEPAPARPAPPKPVVAGPLQVECRHLDPVAEDAVRQWFSKNISTFVTDGERSVRFAHPDDPRRLLKIKGAGFRGINIRFEKHMRSGLKAPIFDFEGRMVEDRSAGHDNAYLGGASFQQCATEYAVTQKLGALGYDVVPCLGFGRVRQGEFSSWFSVMELSADWESYALPHVSVDEYVESKLLYGRQVREMALRHGLVGYFWYMRGDRALPLLKDLHPFRSVDPINMSRTSWVMHVFHALHICSLSTIHSLAKWDADQFPADIQAYVFRAFHPTATKAEHDECRMDLAARFMRGTPETFDPAELDRVLRRYAITMSILDAAPDGFVEY